jgi:hypothetical protein
MESRASSGPEEEQRGSTATRPTCEHSPVPSNDVTKQKPRTDFWRLGGKKQKPRTDALAELLCSHAAAGNLAGVREVLAEDVLM